ncbi:MAG: TAXI family TRAP transporter solute-binding subunit [Isosphaeraceae bacterium]|nr:TAXI family TRAP transporter solute-binding subunit [Isosphaeraceae bacterium]
MALGFRLRRSLWDWLVAALGVAALGVAALIYVRQPDARPVRLTITAGSAEGLRHQVALTLAGEAKGRGVEIRPKPTAGSEEALNRVDAGALDLALVQGGLDIGPRGNVRQVAALYVEPLHLLVKEEIHADVSRHLAALRGKVVNLSEPESGTFVLAREVLDFVGLRRGDLNHATMSYAQLVGERDRGKLPDAVFMVSLLPSPVAKHLVTEQRYRLVPLPFARAFALGAVAESDPSPVRRGVERSSVFDALIPAYTYAVDPPVPADVVNTLGTRLLLVANKNVDADAIGRVLDVVFTTRFAQLALPPLDPKLLDLPPELPWHEGTLAYLGRQKPLIAADVIDLLEKEISIGAAMVGGTFFLWQWFRRRVRRRRDVGFGLYLKRVMAVERKAEELESSAVIDLAELLRLQHELGGLRLEALERYAAGELEGEELMSGFLAHVGDARGYLTRLILHVRENLEKSARAQGRPAGALWHEALGESDEEP